MAIGWPEAIDGAPRRGWTAKEDFLVPRGMAAQPAGEESSTPLLRHRRSRRQPAFGQIRPLKRPFGAVETRARKRRRWRPPCIGIPAPIRDLLAIASSYRLVVLPPRCRRYWRVVTSGRTLPAPMQPPRSASAGGACPRSSVESRSTLQPPPPQTTEAFASTRFWSVALALDQVRPALSPDRKGPERSPSLRPARGR